LSVGWRVRDVHLILAAQHEDDEHDNDDEYNSPDTDIHRCSFP
jgi:hypothetical protein